MQFLHVALGSLGELDTQIEISKVTGLGDEQHLQSATRCYNKS
ncbi:MAG: four helix bundle protein [Acidiferrobacterales bacterium]